MQHCFPTISGQRRRPHPYIPRHSYTPPMRPSRIQHSHHQAGVASISKSFTRDVVLLAPSECCVPRGVSRSRLHDEGQVANMVDFLSRWDEKTRKRIEECFVGILDMNKPYPRYADHNYVFLCGCTIYKFRTVKANAIAIFQLMHTPDVITTYVHMTIIPLSVTRWMLIR